jgi:hypothetical protein
VINLEAVLIASAAAAVVAIAIRLYRARSAARTRPIGRHDILMKRAEAHIDSNAFLRKACRDYRATGHLSERQVEAVERALERTEATASKSRR